MGQFPILSAEWLYAILPGRSAMWSSVSGRSESKRYIRMWKQLSCFPIVEFSVHDPPGSAALHTIERRPYLLYSPVGCLTWCFFSTNAFNNSIDVMVSVWKELTSVYEALKREMVDSSKGCTKESSHQSLGFIFEYSVAMVKRSHLSVLKV